MAGPPLVRIAAPAGVDECWVVGHVSHDDPTRTDLSKRFFEVRHDPDPTPELVAALLDAVAATVDTSVTAIADAGRVIAVPSGRGLPAALAVALADDLGLPAPAEDDLRWVRPIGPMKEVPIEQRATYAVGAMSAAPLDTTTVVLVDDATRSGATFAEAARAVRAAGAARVVCIALVAIER